ncbi:MAG: M23 family metallopeptidase [bacterium]
MSRIKLFLLSITFICGLALTSKAQAVPTMEWPLPGLPDEYVITSDFGDHWQNQYCGGNKQLHTALDLSTSIGTNVDSAYAGTVVASVVYNNDPYDERNFVTISHGSWTTTYHHIRPMVNWGQSVSMGQKIGEVNNHSGGSHLHFGVRDTSYSNTANRGRLPQNSPCGGDPAFPEYFVDPANLNYNW